MSLAHLTDTEIIEAAADPHGKLNALVVDILAGKHGHADLVALVFRIAEVVTKLDEANDDLAYTLTSLANGDHYGSP